MKVHTTRQFSHPPHTTRSQRFKRVQRFKVVQSSLVAILLALPVLCAISATLSGCNTISGAKEDITNVVDAVTPSKGGPTQVEQITREPDIRVRVSRASSQAQISGPTRFVIRPVRGTGATARPIACPGPITIASSDKGIQITDGLKKLHSTPFGVDVEVLASDGTAEGAAEIPSESLRLNGRALPGFLTVRPQWSTLPTAFDVTVSMPIETYLPGVLSRELMKDWPRQAFEAQAVAARTYAIQERFRARKEGRVVDVEDTTSDQVFGGTTFLISAVEAVRATRGWVITENGRFIRAYFSSQCGGRSASAATAWSSRSVPEFNRDKSLQAQSRQHYCQRATYYRWTLTRTTDDINKRLRAWGKAKGQDISGITRLREVTVADRNEVSRPSSYTLTSDTGRQYTLAAEELREAFNWTVPGLTPITSQNRIHSSDLEVTIFANEARISGRGFGHGVGMCQWCAKGMADAGMDWRTMLEKFYPGADIRKLY